MIELARRSGFYEHYDPTTGRGHGSRRFAWTAALVLNLLFEEEERKDGRRSRDGSELRGSP